MKKCPNCKKEINDQAKICPHCGKPLGYQAIGIKQNKKNGKQKYLTLFFFILLCPVFFSGYMLANNTLGNSSKDDVLGTVIMTVSSLEDYEKTIPNSSNHVKQIKALEKEIESLATDYTIQKDYMIYIVSNHNHLFYPTYTLQKDDQQIQLELNFDLENKLYYANIDYRVGYFNDFKSMIEENHNYQLVDDLTRLLSDKEDFDPTSKVVKQLSKLEESFESRKDRLGNYGLTSQDETKEYDSSISITSIKDQYRLLLTTTFDTKPIMKK